MNEITESNFKDFFTNEENPTISIWDKEFIHDDISEFLSKLDDIIEKTYNKLSTE